MDASFDLAVARAALDALDAQLRLVKVERDKLAKEVVELRAQHGAQESKLGGAEDRTGSRADGLKPEGVCHKLVSRGTKPVSLNAETAQVATGSSAPPFSQSREAHEAYEGHSAVVHPLAEQLAPSAPGLLKRVEVVREIATVLNRNNCEGGSNTPDFVLGELLVACMEAFDAAVKARERLRLRRVPQ